MKIKRYIKIFINIFIVFGIDGFRILVWLVFNKVYNESIKRVYCRNLKKRVYVRAGSTDVILMVLMFCVDCDENGRQEYDIDLGNRNIEYIIDAGANIGLFALLYAKKYPNAKIICIEPDEDNFRILNMNVSDNTNIYAVKKGLWSKETYLKMIDRNTGNWGFMVKESSGEGGADVLLEAVTVSELIMKYQFPRVDILKLDIEGSEYEVFSESCNKWLEKVGIVFIETHDSIVPGCDHRVTDVMQNDGFVEQERNGENRIFFRATAFN